MNTEDDISQRYDDLIFENRNKTYGAYSIRREYGSNLSKGSIASFLFMACLFGVAYAAMMLKTEIIDRIPKDSRRILTGVKIIPNQQEHKEFVKQVKRSNAFPTRVVTQEVSNKPVEDTQTTNLPDGQTTGTSDATPSIGIGIEQPVTPAVIEPPQTVDIAEIMPEFEGGQKALYKFLRRTLRYPAVSEKTGEKGTVFVRFIIDATGTVTGIEVIKGVSAAIDKEASRVISLMPHWKPGMQHGTPVNVRMVLPIKFEIGEE